MARYEDDSDDEHEHMRLNVDNMTYEELLALQERIGNVNIGLSEAAISKAMKSCKHQQKKLKCLGETLCCICQENFVDGEKIGKVDCGHEFHANCIKKWLKMKNLCPICKTTALAV